MAFYDDKLDHHIGVAYFEDATDDYREVCVTALSSLVDPQWVEVRREDKDGVVVTSDFKWALDTWGADFEAAFDRAQAGADEAHINAAEIRARDERDRADVAHDRARKEAREEGVAR